VGWILHKHKKLLEVVVLGGGHKLEARSIGIDGAGNHSEEPGGREAQDDVPGEIGLEALVIDEVCKLA